MQTEAVKKRFLTKGAKKAKLAITSTQRIAATNLPEGSVFKGYKRWIRQELQILAATICYELEHWQAPNGSYHYATLPD